ncbi:MAG: hypothetical protein LBE02_05420 [Spirochaetaceae bacterium]|jgi:hypothetical protein|nr:hypothetical protein [Spirochaetaceae bacterium]
MDSLDWQEITYREAYEREIRGLRRRLEADPACSGEDLAGTLKHLYIMEGADWLGRGEVQNITLAAAIAAHEAVIEELDSSAKKNSGQKIR